jgi:hypothetical protein
VSTVLAPALLWAAAVAAQGVPPPLPRTVEFPTHPLGPSVVALGGAGAGWSPDAAGSLNPATLFLAPRVSVYHYEGFADYGGDFAAGSVPIRRRFAVGASLRRLGWDHIIEDDLGVPTDGLRTGDAQYTLTLAAALAPRLHLGVAASRLISDNLGVRISATSWSLGALVSYASAGWAGVALLHAGATVRTSTGETYSLPTVVRLGVHQQVMRRVNVVMDGVVPPGDTDAWTAHAGVEWRAPVWVVLRAGIESLASAGSVEHDTRLASGLGLVVGPIEVSLTTRFGGVAGSQEWFVGLDALRPRP